MQIKIVALNARFTHSCLALFHVRNELEKKCPGMEIELCQLTINDSYYETLLRLSHGDPDYIFFSAAVWNSDRVEQLIHDLKGCLPDCGVVVGGECSGKTIDEAIAFFQETSLPYFKARKAFSQCKKTCCNKALMRLFDMVYFGKIDKREIVEMIGRQ